MPSQVDNAFNQFDPQRRGGTSQLGMTAATMASRSAADAIKKAMFKQKLGMAPGASSQSIEIIRDPELLNKVKHLQTFKVIPVSERSQVAEEFRILRTNIQSLQFPPNKNSIMFTSCHHSEGKTTSALYLSIFMAKNPDKRILLVDCDLRRPKVAKKLRIRPRVDLVDVVKGADIHEGIIYSREHNLSVMMAKRQYSNATEIFEMPRFQEVMDFAHREYDFVVIDTCPVLCAADPCVIGDYVGGSLLVIRTRKTQRETINSAIETLDEANIEVKGILLNFVKMYVPKKLYRYQYYRGYYYYEEGY